MTKKSSKDNFSVALGLTDYINPVMYLITSVVIILNLDKIMTIPWNIIYLIGVISSIIFGFAIPTIKLLVGLGKIEFKLPVKFVFFVNTGLFISGLTLIKNILDMNIIIFILLIIISLIILSLIYLKTKKFNNIAIIIGAIGYLYIYISLIYKALNSQIYLPMVFYSFAILMCLMLIIIGLKEDLKDARVHWVLEISNILCQASVAIGTIILFINC